MKSILFYTIASFITVFALSTVTGKEVTPIPVGDWQEHGFNNDQRDSIRSAFQTGIDRSFIPGGSMMLFHEGETIFLEAFGLADLENKQPFTTDTPCRIASLTKPHTATMIAMLVDQEKLAFDDTVDKYIPAFETIGLQGQEQPTTAPTLANCLSHTAGFASNNDLKAGKFTLNFNGALDQITRELATKKLFHAPGTNYAYSRLGYMTAGRVAEISSF